MTLKESTGSEFLFTSGKHLQTASDNVLNAFNPQISATARSTGALKGVKVNPVEIGGGPAAVTGGFGPETSMA